MKPYEALAAVYDRLGEKPDYNEYAAFFSTCCKRYDISPSLVLDLGCGTGAMTLALAARGYDMIGVDGSEQMLSRAYERMYKEGASGVLFLEQDMRAFELYGTVGAVVSTLDCVNYLTGDGDLAKCFSLVHNYLDPDGIFLFDVNTPYKFAHIYGDNAYILEDEIDGQAVWCGWQNAYDTETGLCDFYLTLFEEDEDGRYLRSEEHQRERCFTHETLLAALERAGFAYLGTWADYRFTSPDESTERWYIAARAIKQSPNTVE